MQVLLHMSPTTACKPHHDTNLPHENLAMECKSCHANLLHISPAMMPTHHAQALP